MASNRSSLLLSSLSALDTNFNAVSASLAATAQSAETDTNPDTESPSVFSSDTISSMASSASSAVGEKKTADLRHPTPQRYTAAQSPFLKLAETSNRMVVNLEVPERPLSPMSPIVARKMHFEGRPEYVSFFDFDSESEESVDSPAMSTEEVMMLRAGGLRAQWADISRAPTPAPETGLPSLPQREAIFRWEAEVAEFEARPPSAVSRPATSLGWKTPSPVEMEIGCLSRRIAEMHQRVAQSDQVMKSGMLQLYLRQNATAARLVTSPTDEIVRSSSRGSIGSIEGFVRKEMERRVASDELRQRKFVEVAEVEEIRMQGVKASLRERLELEVIEIERRALRDLQMAREVRFGLMMEAEQEAARERRRELEFELEEERLKLEHAVEPSFDDEEEEEEEQESPYIIQSAVSTTVTPARIRSFSVKPVLSLNTALSNFHNLVSPATPLLKSAASPIMSPLMSFLASPMTPCSPGFGSKRQSLAISAAMDVGLGLLMDGDMGFENTRRVAACA